MNASGPIPIEQLAEVAKHGSPAMLSAVGRLFGLGQGEQQALVNGKFPAWSVLLVGLAGGFVVGAYAYRKWPSAMGKVVGGKK